MIGVLSWGVLWMFLILCSFVFSFLYYRMWVFILIVLWLCLNLKLWLKLFNSFIVWVLEMFIVVSLLKFNVWLCVMKLYERKWCNYWMYWMIKLLFGCVVLLNLLIWWYNVMCVCVCNWVMRLLLVW